MKLFGWGLIVLFGGGIFFVTARVVFWSLTDYYVGAELSEPG